MVSPSRGSGQVGGQDPGTDSACSLHFTASLGSSWGAGKGQNNLNLKKRVVK